MHAATLELDEEEHVEPLQRDRLDREEVDGKHALRLRAEKRSPGEPGALARRTEPRALEELTHRGCRDDNAQPPRSSPTIRW